MPEVQSSLSVTIDGTPDLHSEVLKALYRVTGRSTVELRRAIAAGEAVYTAALFGDEHIVVVPRLEQTIGLLEQLGLPFRLHETADGETEEITRDTMRDILGP